MVGETTGTAEKKQLTSSQKKIANKNPKVGKRGGSKKRGTIADKR